MKVADVKLFATPSATRAVIAALLAGPLIWLTALQLNFTIVPFACWYQWRLVLHLVDMISLALVLGAAGLSWQSWRAAGSQAPGEEASYAERNRFLAALALALNGFSFLAILGQEIGNWMLQPCH